MTCVSRFFDATMQNIDTKKSVTAKVIKKIKEIAWSWKTQPGPVSTNRKLGMFVTHIIFHKKPQFKKEQVFV
jgi:hypothetical protein